jgi:SagB-type dehydrogenase family enzyme
MAARYLLRLSERFEIRCQDGILALQGTRYPRFDFSGPGLRQAVQVLADRGAALQDLESIATAHGGKRASRELQRLLGRLSARKLLDGELWLDDELLAIVQPTVDGRFAPASVDAQAHWRLGRHSFFRRDGDRAVLESAVSGFRVLMMGWKAAAVLHALCEPCYPGEIAPRIPGLNRSQADVLLSLLVSLGFVERGEANESIPERMWEFHDLLFHFRSRAGYSGSRSGATFRFRAAVEPLAAVKPPMSSEAIRLKKPSGRLLRKHDARLSLVMNRRKSWRVPSASPISDVHLGEFLYRCARIDEIKRAGSHETLRRPYPGAGSIHELEFYVAVDQCENVQKGLYHYDGLRHVLYRLPSEPQDVSALFDHAAAAWGKPSVRPHVVVILAARFGRMTWKYEGLAYRLILLDAGIAMQTMYLVATAMGLGPCALGNGDSALFARATGLDPFLEGSVGEFALSGVPEGVRGLP